MSTELRHGKYTEQEYVNLLMSRMLLFEQVKINKGLEFLELKLQDILFQKDASNNINNDKVSILSMNTNSIVKRFEEKVEEIKSKEQAIIFCDFMDILPNLLNECTRISVEENDAGTVISSFELVMDDIPAFRRRHGKSINSDTETIFKNITEEIVELKGKNSKLKWNRDPKTLLTISNKLFENETTNNKNAFANTINKGELCVVNPKRKDFFVLLLYKLIEGENRMIVTERKSGKGGIGVASRFFWHQLKTGNRSISLPDQMKRLNKKLLVNDENLNKIKLEVDSFMQEF